MAESGSLHRRGIVTSFDFDRGTGTVRDNSAGADDSAGADYPFHCVALVDGSRYVAVGQPVRFAVGPGHAGRWEARRIEADTPQGTFACPVCGTPVEGRARTYEICPRCGWEDDPAQFDDIDSVGANTVSLRNARRASTPTHAAD